MQDEAAALKRLASWFREEALPLWAARGYDHERGGFYEALDYAGQPVRAAPRRVRVQARQIYVFSNAARLGWHDEAERLARAGFEYFLKTACPDEGARGCVHVLSPEGQILDVRCDLYDQAFLLLACSAFWSAFKDPRALDFAARTIAFLERDLAAPGGGFWEDDQDSRPRRQNPHMHLFEAFLALHAATGEAQWAERADQMFELLGRRFFDCEHRILREFFSDDLVRVDDDQGDLIEPGHMAEWVWLLDKRQISDPATRGIQEALYESATALGRDPESGFLVDRIRWGDRAKNATRRLWPQTEYIKAGLARARCGEIEGVASAERLAASLFDTYLDQPVSGLWCDQYDSAGRPIAQDVPASILYHLFEAAREIDAFIAKDGE